jgi:polyvinyl alcohol dehydrogenase (cytochrome)
MRALRCSLVALLTCLVVAAPAAADWPVYGHDLANSRNAGAEGPSVADASSLAAAWTFNSSNGDFTGTPAVAGGVLVAGTNLGTVYALDAVTGAVRWSRDVDAPVNAAAAIDLDAPGGPLAFVPVARLGSPHLVALSLGDGSVRWDAVLTRQADSYVYGSPTFWDGTVYIGTSGPNSDESTARGSVVALDEASGGVRWQTFTVPEGHDGGAVWSTPAIYTETGRLFVGTGNAYHEPAAATTDAILALDARSGELLGHFQTSPGDVWQMNDPFAGPDYDFGASPNLIEGADGRRLVGEGSKSGTYWALGRESMQPAWSAEIGPGSAVGGIMGSTAYDGTRIYGSDSLNAEVWTVGRDGAPQWSSSDGGTLDFAPVTVANGVLYSVASSGVLTARDATDGRVLAKLALGGPSFGGVAAAGRAVYAAVGVGPPPRPDPAFPDTTSMDGSGSIVAFGDTSASGAKPAAKPPARAARSHRNAFRLSVAPRRVEPGRRVTFRFRARRGAHALRGVAVRLAGRRVRTNRHGRATMRARLTRNGTYLVEAWRRGLGKATATVEARGNRRADPAPAPATRGALTFDGSCEFTGIVTFTPALTNDPQDVRQDVQAKGTCDGTLTDVAGKAHDLGAAPVTYRSTANATSVSCGYGINAGSGTLEFEYSPLGFDFQETRAGPFPLLQLTGKKDGSALGTAMPAQDQDPTAALECSSGGLKQFKLSGGLQTTEPMSG